MTWIPVDDSLRDHRKTLVLARELGIPKVAAIGHLLCLWWWALDNAPDGLLRGVSPDILSQSMCYIGDPELLVAALTKAGFIHRVGRGGCTLRLHNWELYTGALIQKRARDRERMRALRSADGALTVREQSCDDARTVAARSGLQDRTGQDRKLHDRRAEDPTPPVVPPAGGDGDRDRHAHLRRWWQLSERALLSEMSRATVANQKNGAIVRRWRRRFGRPEEAH